MGIRWKFLLVLLAISLLPMVLMRWVGQRSMQELGNDLATRTRDVLIRETSTKLKNLVEEHVYILRRERDLVEMALLVQASELEKLFANQPVQTAKGKTGVLSAANSGRMETELNREKHILRMGMMTGRPLAISYEKLTEWVPSGVSQAAAKEIKDKVSHIIPVYRSLGNKHPDLVLWQLTGFENGMYTVFPAFRPMPMMRSDFETDWYQLAKQRKRIVWSKPTVDPITMKMVFTVSLPFYESDGEIAGVTAIVVPVDVFLQEDQHIRELSHNIRSLLVRPEAQSPAAETSIRILAREQLQNEMHHHWRPLLEDEWLELDNTQQLRSIVKDLQQEYTRVRKISFMGQDSLLAYGSIDDYQTALLIIVPEEDVVAEAKAMESYVLTRIKHQIKVTSIMLSSVILLVIGLAFMLSRSITGNISKLVNAVRQVASGDFAARVHTKTRDEIGELGRTFNRMVPELEERVAMKQALDFAMEVQQNLLPKDQPQTKGLDIAGRSIYCDETGGDFYDFLDIGSQPSDRIAIAVGDVSGHGISAALLMASVRAFFRSRVRQPGSVAEIVSDVNHLVAEDTGETGQFMTLFYAEIAPDQKTLRWVRAGHDPALYYDSATKQFEELRGDGMALGIDSDLKYEENSISGLSAGQILLLGTDGLWETQNEKGEMFGKERLKMLMRQHAHTPAENILTCIINSWKDFQHSVKPEDDITLVIVKIQD